MTKETNLVLEQALRLSVKERAEVVAELLESLPEEQLHPEWELELERRARRARRDPEGGEPWEEVEQRLRSRIPS